MKIDYSLCRIVATSSRYFRTSSYGSAAEVDHLERQHTTDNSFAKPNNQYLSHPHSTDPSASAVKQNNTYLHRLKTGLDFIKTQLINDFLQSESELLRTPNANPKPDSSIVYLTKDELAAAKKNMPKRYGDIISSHHISLMNRSQINPEQEKDPGLNWLYESDVTFVDCSEVTSNCDRYIITRQVDGTLYHNNQTERDTINGSFFLQPKQIYPPLEFLEQDELFSQILYSNKIDLTSILDLLEQCYSVDHPIFHKRYGQITHMVLNDREVIKSIIHTRHFLPIVEKALTDNQQNVHILVDYLQDTGRFSVASEVLTLLYFNHPRSCKDGENYQSAKIVIVNGRSLEINTHRTMRRLDQDIYMASLICNIEERDVKSLKVRAGSHGTDFIVHLQNADVAEKLHNGGRGNSIIYNKKRFEIFPEKEQSKFKNKKYDK